MRGGEAGAVWESVFAERAPTLTLPRKREREWTVFGADTVFRTRSLSSEQTVPPLPLAGEQRSLSVPSPLVGEGQGGG